jgi:hypothetical protein
MIDIPVPWFRVLYSWEDPSGATPRIFPAAAALAVLNPVPPFAGLRGVLKDSDVALAAPRVGVTRIGEVSVLFVRVSVVALPTKVSVLVGNVIVPVLEIDDMTGEVSVLFVRVSVVALPTNVSVLVGNVIVPVLLMLEMNGVVRVLLVRVCVPVSETRTASLLPMVVPPGSSKVLLAACAWV